MLRSEPKERSSKDDDKDTQHSFAGYYAAAMGVWTGVFGVLTGIGLLLLPKDTTTELLLILGAGAALSTGSVVGFRAWKSAARFAASATSAGLAIICLAALSMVANDVPRIAGTAAAPRSGSANPRTVPSSSALGPSASQGSDTAQPSGSSVPSATTAPSTYLSEMTPLQDTEPGVDNVIDRPQKIGFSTYPNSVRFVCDATNDWHYPGATTIVYNVAGYKTLKATIGVPSDATDASGNTATIKFLKDGTTTPLASPATIALDQSENITLKLQGASDLTIDCNGSAGEIDIVFANASLNP